MPSTVVLLLTLILFFFPGHSHSQATHEIEHGEAQNTHSSLSIHHLPEDKAYSEFMHQLNGIFVLLLGTLAFVERKLPNGGLLRWGWPLLFLLSGVFLVVQSDRNSWPIGEKGLMESLQDPMTLQHKIAAAILLLLGLSELFLRAGWRQETLGWVFPLLAISAGILLLVHGHTGHQESNIYMQHLLMGGTAMSIGATKFLSVKFRGSESAWLFLLLLLGLELLFYTE